MLPLKRHRGKSDHAWEDSLTLHRLELKGVERVGGGTEWLPNGGEDMKVLASEWDLAEDGQD